MIPATGGTRAETTAAAPTLAHASADSASVIC